MKLEACKRHLVVEGNSLFPGSFPYLTCWHLTSLYATKSFEVMGFDSRCSDVNKYEVENSVILPAARIISENRSSTLTDKLMMETFGIATITEGSLKGSKWLIQIPRVLVCHNLPTFDAIDDLTRPKYPCAPHMASALN